MDISKYDRLIIDGNNFIFRAYHTKRPPVITNGVNTTPLFQFLTMLKTIVSQFRADEIILTWDKKLLEGSTNYRKQLVPYKEQRVESDTTKDIFRNIELLQPILDSLGIITMRPYNFEADDIITYMAEYSYSGTTLVVTADHDLLQIISNTTHVYIPNKNTIITMENFEEEIGINFSYFLLYKAILGDVADNISGLFKYGPVKAKRLAEDIINKGIYREFLDYPASNLDPAVIGLNDEQIATIQRNLKIMDLHHSDPTLIAEKRLYFDQYNEKKDIKMDVDKFRALCYLYNFIPFIREMGIWRNLFDKSETKNEDEDLLLCISM